ncbi:Hypothetical predicted protein [Mytilus galloprovincialis]|uniref:EGF-like domain-containing protein n=1 Tax=Mytilus galloprovincialis TaxID=29158 RepID=A0A8B6DXE0_MYTGA|nr:Hypothetical predicted protein [Mytilus galloprovincialis]
MADNRNSNGNYVIHHNGNAISVYCSFESNYGYTYISKQSYTADLNITLLYTTLDFAKIRHRKSNGKQKEVIVENLSSFQSLSTLYFGYNTNTAYQGPDSRNAGLKPYLFLGFLPESLVRNKNTQGYRAAGKDFTFRNCDANPNSYITFYYNPNNTSPGRLGYSSHVRFMEGWMDNSELLQMNNYMDTDFYFDWEMHMGGCGGFRTSHYMSNTRAALGLPFSIQPCDGLNCQNGGSCDSSVSPACCICVGNYFGDRCENINGGWTEWSVWSDCPETCGDEDLIRTRSCTNPSPENNGTVCQGSNTETLSCTTAQCPVNGGWTEWSVWSDCPETCNDEDLIRIRSCTNPSPENNGTVCQGHTSETISCYTANCPVNGGWTEWSVWSDCPETCGDEDLIRTRSCTNPSPENNGTVCQGSSSETVSCTIANCPINGGWTEWSVWSDCPETCNDEDLIRTRSCTNPLPDNNGTACQGNNTETISCYTANCPVNGGWTEWSVWSDCPETCGDEDLIRTRSCTNPSPENNGTVCQGSSSETVSCTIANCPINGGWTEWSVWSDCPETCNDEDLIRTRSCTNPSPDNNGTACQGNTTETISCYTANCPVNGGWTEWSVWSDCPETCVEEDLIRTRSCTNPSPENNGTVCQGSNTETISCTTAQCQVNGGWIEWSVWSDCPETCNDEDLIRIRSCTNPSPDNNGTACQGNTTETISCSTAKCPVNGGWTTWTPWSSCPETCNDEYLNRTRSCSNPASVNNGTDCQGIDIEFKSCQAAQCPVNGGWTTWSSWTSCPEMCNGEKLSRTRSCSNPESDNNGTDCQGIDIEYISCQEAQCPVNGHWSTWTSWTSCPETCNGEYLNRTRTCSNPASENNGTDCQGNDIEFKSCQTADCPVDGDWASWSSWTDCPVNCKGEILSRKRNCTNPMPQNGGKYCIGNETETSSCEALGCPCIVDGGWSPWSSWSACPYSCHGHVLTRERTCTNPEPTNGGTYCTGNSTDTTSCESQGCPCKGYLNFDMGSGFTRLSFNWKLFGVLSAVLFVWR